MQHSAELTYQSLLATSAAEVWRIVGTMAGVNAELGPWLSMTHPELPGFHLEDVQAGQPLFSSWVLFLGILPVDRHHLQIEHITPGAGFIERSRTWVQHSWMHARSITPQGDHSCVLRDQLQFQPRIALLTPLVTRIADATFKHRHAQLQRRFGGGER